MEHQGLNRQLVDEALRVAEAVTKDFRDLCDMHHIDESEDYADAFYMVGTLFRSISSFMLHSVYKDDDDRDVVDHMEMIAEQGRNDWDEVKKTLIPFGIELKELS